MSVYFYSIVPTNPKEECVVCFEPLEKDLVAHHNLNFSKSLHPIHEKCLIQWADYKLECPICRININPYNLDLQSLKKVRYFLDKFNNLTPFIGCLLASAENNKTFSFETSMGFSVTVGILTIFSAEVLEKCSYRSTKHLLKQAAKLTTLYAITIGSVVYGAVVVSHLKLDLCLPILNCLQFNSSLLLGIPRHVFTIVTSACLTNVASKICKIFKEYLTA